MFSRAHVPGDISIHNSFTKGSYFIHHSPSPLWYDVIVRKKQTYFSLNILPLSFLSNKTRPRPGALPGRGRVERVEKVRHASQKCKHFFEGMQPAAYTLGSKGDPRPHWRAEKCFFRCSCPRKKQILIHFPAPRRENSAEGLRSCKIILTSCRGFRFFDSLNTTPVGLPARPGSCSDCYKLSSMCAMRMARITATASSGASTMATPPLNRVEGTLSTTAPQAALAVMPPKNMEL